MILKTRNTAGGALEWHRISRILMTAALIVLLTTVVFDPADLVLHLKVPAFAFCWLVMILEVVVTAGSSWKVGPAALIYVLLFALLLPVFSIELYLLMGGNLDRSESLQYLKSYLFLTIALPLLVQRINIIPVFSALLTLLAVLTIAIYFFTLNNDLLLGAVQLLGDKYDIMEITQRSYGPISYRPIYFHTSPLLVIPISYFAAMVIRSKGARKSFAAVALSVNIVGMFLSGTRNNIIASIMLPLAVFWWYSSKKMLFTALAICFALGMVAVNLSSIKAAVSLQDESNGIKYLHWLDYEHLLQHPTTSLVGAGVGSRFYSHGFESTTSVTELTYLELFREYGVFLFSLVAALLLVPLRGLLRQEHRRYHYLFVAYIAYLGICALNPLLLSSSGMILLASVISVYFARSQESLSGHAKERICFARSYV